MIDIHLEAETKIERLYERIMELKHEIEEQNKKYEKLMEYISLASTMMPIDHYERSEMLDRAIAFYKLNL